MKSLVIFFSMLISVSAFSKSEPVLVACSDDQVNYNVLFLLEDRQVVSYSINEGNWGEAVVLTSEEVDMLQVEAAGRLELRRWGPSVATVPQGFAALLSSPSRGKRRGEQ